jgi:UDP-3-O-[3-hydroxymyristoyl] glucosamine N-acyltransferase
MTDTVIEASATLSLNDIVEIAGVALPAGADGRLEVRGAAALETAQPDQIAYMDNAKYADALSATRAGVCLVSSRFAQAVPDGTVGLVCKEPYRSYAQVVTRLYPDATRPQSNFGESGVSPHALIHPTARLADDVMIDPGAIVGAEAEIGAGTRIGAYAVVGPRVRIGRNCSISAHVTVMHATLGYGVILHPGVRIGQDGFGYVMGAQGHLKVPQLGRVVVGDNVEIGANSTIDRGSGRDTVIGEGTKIDNLVQIAHNVTIGRHCVIVAQVGIAGSTTLEDFVAVGGQTAIGPHLRLRRGAQIAADAGVMTDVPPGERWGGSPARPMRHFFREYHAVKALAGTKGSGAS